MSFHKQQEILRTGSESVLAILKVQSGAWKSVYVYWVVKTMLDNWKDWGMECPDWLINIAQAQWLKAMIRKAHNFKTPTVYVLIYLPYLALILNTELS